MYAHSAVTNLSFLHIYELNLCKFYKTHCALK